MKALKTLLLGAGLLAVSANVQAQNDEVKAWKGVRLGYEYAPIDVSAVVYNDTWKFNNVRIGYVHSFRVIKQLPLFVETGGMFSYGRWSGSIYDLDFDDDDYTFTPDEKLVDVEAKRLSLVIPANIVYAHRINKALTLKPYAGMYMRVNMMFKGSYKWTEEDAYYNPITGNYETFITPESQNVDMFDSKKCYPLSKAKRVQMGIQTGCTAEYKFLNLGLGFAYDVSSLASCMSNGFTVSLTAGVNF